MHVLVTGATGFIGTVLVHRLLRSGHRVTYLCRPGSPDLADATRMERALDSGAALTLPCGVDAVAHLAQSRDYRSFPQDAQTMFAVNVSGAQNVMMAAAAAGVTRFCLVSSGTVYEPFDSSLDECVALRPISYLGATKLAAEALARPFSNLFPISILRLFAPYGPGQTSRLIPDLVRRIQTGKRVTLPLAGEGMSFSPTYVDDLVGVIETALNEAWTGTFNVASPEVLTIANVANEIGVVLGRRPLFERMPIAAPSITPRLNQLAAKYDLARFRPFSQGIRLALAAGH